MTFLLQYFSCLSWALKLVDDHFAVKYVAIAYSVKYHIVVHTGEPFDVLMLYTGSL